jgi:phage terminase large subunit
MSNIVEVSTLDGQSLDYWIPEIKVATESYKAFKEGYRIIVNQGGTRSGKTYTMTQLLIALALKDKCSISITSVAFPHLRRGAMRDWRTIMENSGLYDQNHHVRTEQVYNYPNGSYIEFFSSDNNLKVRGPGRDILFFNEANLTDFDTFTQLMLRTRKAIFIDFNPADEFHWIYDNILTRKDCYFIKSTYLDNPFLPHEQVKEIENLRNVDANFWRIYGEGERGHSEGVIYTHWQPYSGQKSGHTVFGLDFGYNNPTALTRVTDNDGELYWKEEIYQSHLTNSDLIPMLKQIVKPHETIYCDAAEPNRIEELRRAGIKAQLANKNVKEGIDFVKSRKLYIHSQSVNLLKEIKSYKYMDQGKKKGNEPEVPLKLNDHCFSGDSLVMTDTGERAMVEINEGDLVLTSQGLKKVLIKWDNGKKLIKSYWLHFDTISVNLHCTPDHKISTDKGWIEISKLQLGMTVSLSSSSTAGSILSTQGKDTLEAISMLFTGTYGNFTMAVGREDSIFTTSMITRGITELETSNLKSHRSIFQTIVKKGTKKIRRGLKFLRKKVLKPLKRGTKALKVALGISNTRLITISESKHTEPELVKFAELLFKDRQAPTNFAIQTARLKRFEEEGESFEDVYDLTVEDAHEYFVSGVLVHNCMDAARYGSMAFKKAKVGLHLSWHK